MNTVSGVVHVAPSNDLKAMQGVLEPCVAKVALHLLNHKREVGRFAW